MRGRIALGTLFAALILSMTPSAHSTLRAQQPVTRAYAIRGCDLGYMYECGRAGRMMMDGTDGPKDLVAARRYLDRSCNGETAIACGQLGDALLNGSFGGAPDLRGAMGYFARACQLGVAISCTNEALAALQLGEMVRSRAVAIKGCQSGDSGGCRIIGVLMSTGKGGAADPVMAAAYFNQACKMNDQAGCQALASARSKGRLPANLPAISIAPTTPNEGRRPAVAAAAAAPPAPGTLTAAKQRYVNILNEHNAKVRIATSSIQNATVGTGKREKCIWLNDARLNMQEAMRMAEQARSIAVQERFEPYYVNGAQEVIDRANTLIGKVTTEQGNLRC